MTINGLPWKANATGVEDCNGLPVALLASDRWQHAALLAAAPDLLRALRGLIDSAGARECIYGGDYHETPTVNVQAEHCPWCAADAAIARAEGTATPVALAPERWTVTVDVTPTGKTMISERADDGREAGAILTKKGDWHAEAFRAGTKGVADWFEGGHSTARAALDAARAWLGGGVS